MTFDDVFEQLKVIDTAAASLLKATGFHPDEGLPAAVRPLRDPAQDIFLREFTENMLESLEQLHEEIAYLNSPVSGDYRLEPFPDGRYGFFDKAGAAHSLSCGKTIEAKIHDRYGRPCWARCRIEHDGSDYYLWGPMEEGHSMDIPLAGLTIREREVRHDF